MESYIVRVYRRNGKDPANVVGLVEIVETRERKAFKNAMEMWEIMSPKTSGKRKRGMRVAAKRETRRKMP